MVGGFFLYSNPKIHYFTYHFVTYFIMSRRRRPHVRRQKRSLEYLWPFLLIIFGGIILVLIVQFAWSFLDQREVELKNKIYLDLAAGEAEMLPWGQTTWIRAYDEQLVLEGDMLAMERESRGTLEFYNGSHVRMDEETKVNIEAIETDKDLDEIELELRTGTMWLNVQDEVEDALRMVVLTDNLRVTSYGTVFEVGITDRETVRVMEGEVLVEVLEQESDREVVLEQIKVGVGQEITITAADMETIMARQPVNLLAALDDEWKTTDWYSWNDSADVGMLVAMVEVTEDPAEVETTATVTLEGELPEEEASEEVVEEIEEEEIVEEVEEEEYDPTPPEVVVSIPAFSPRTLDAEEDELPFSMRGTASSNTASIVVTSYTASGAASPYTLQHFQSGDVTWRYGISEEYGNIREGRNLFTIVATNVSGVRSEALEIIIEVPEGFLDQSANEESAQSEDEAEVDESTEVEAEAEEVTEEDLVEEEAALEAEEDVVEEEVAPEVVEPLTAPAVTSLNGTPLDGTYSTSAASVLVLGTVDDNAVNVYVNGFKLTKFVAGSGEWSYYCEDQHLNYDVGTNTYVVYVEDADGNVSDNFTFEIYRVAP